MLGWAFDAENVEVTVHKIGEGGNDLSISGHGLYRLFEISSLVHFSYFKYACALPCDQAALAIKCDHVQPSNGLPDALKMKLLTRDELSMYHVMALFTLPAPVDLS